MPGDDNSGVFIGGWPDPGNDPFVAVNQGYEVQIDATDDADSQTGAIYNVQAPNAAARDQALNPPGQWNTYEITVDAPKVYVRLNGWLVNEFTSTDPARDLTHGRIGLQNHGTGDEVYFRDVQVKEHGKLGELPCTGPRDLGRRRVRGRGLRRLQVGPHRALRPGHAAPVRRRAARRDLGRRHLRRRRHRADQRRAPGRAGGRLDGRDHGEGPAGDVLPAGRPDRARQRRRLRQVRRDRRRRPGAVRAAQRDRRRRRAAGDQRVAAVPGGRHLPAAADQDRRHLQRRLPGHRRRVEHVRHPVTNTAVAGAPVGLFALGIFQDAPIYASFQSFDITRRRRAGRARRCRASPTRPTGDAPLEVAVLGHRPIDRDGGIAPATAGTSATARARSSQIRCTPTGRPATYEATVTVTDDEGDDGDRHRARDGHGAGQPAAARRRRRRPTCGAGPLTVELEALGSDPEGGPLTYEWDFGDGGGQFGAVGRAHLRDRGQLHGHRDGPRQRRGDRTADDRDHGRGPAGQPAAHGARAGRPADPARRRCACGSRRRRATSRTARNLLVVWDFGDGGQGGGEALWHTYTTPGTYQAKVTVTDRGGASASATVPITVTGPGARAAPERGRRGRRERGRAPCA